MIELGSHSPKQPRSVAVIGGGIAGLAAAHRLGEIAPDSRVTLFEASDRLGGVLQTDIRDGYLIERSADMFVTKPDWAVDLSRRAGLVDELIGTDERFRRALVVHRGRLAPVPAGFALLQPARIWPLITTPLLSWRGKLRTGLEYFVPRRRVAKSDGTDAAGPADESLASFARRRLGREAFERLVQPLVAGIYAADPEKLSLAATLPRFLEMEREYRSLIRAAWQERRRHARMKHESAEAQAGGARYGLFVAPRRGMASLVQAVADRLRNVSFRLKCPVSQLRRASGGFWRVEIAGGAANSADFDAVIIAAPAHVAADLVNPFDEDAATQLGAIEYASAAIVCLGYQRSQISHPLDCFGFVAPAVERRQVFAASFASVKFAGRASGDRVLIRAFIGGALQPESLDQDDDELKAIARRELAQLLNTQGEPEFVEVVRWRRSMPQYHLGHLDRVERIESALSTISGLYVAGSAYHGVGIPHCIRSGCLAAERAMARTR